MNSCRSDSRPFPAGKRAISRYDWSKITCSPTPRPCSAFPSHQVSTGRLRNSAARKFIVVFGVEGRNHTGSPPASTIIAPRWPGPDDGARKSSPGAVPGAERSTVTTGGTRSGRETKRRTCAAVEDHGPATAARAFAPTRQAAPMPAARRTSSPRVSALPGVPGATSRLIRPRDGSGRRRAARAAAAATGRAPPRRDRGRGCGAPTDPGAGRRARASRWRYSTYR